MSNSILRDCRCQSETVGIVLLLGMTIISISGMMYIGASAIGDVQHGVETDNAENSMTEFSSTAALVSVGESRSQRTQLSGFSDGQFETNSDAGRIKVTHSGTILLNEKLGSVEYRIGDTLIGYQAGGVWRTEARANYSTMISPPETHYRGATLTLPVITVDGDASGTPDAVTIEQEATEGITDGYTNPLQGGTVTVTVESKYYQAWGRFFEDRTDGEVSYDHGGDTVTLELRNTYSRASTVDGAITSGATDPDDKIDFDNKLIINAYDSSEGEKPKPNGVSQNQQGGTIKIAGDLELSGKNVRIVSNVSTAGTVQFEGNNARIEQGDLLCGASSPDCASGGGYKPGKSIKNGDEINTGKALNFPEPKTGLVNQKLAGIRAVNDNNETTSIAGSQLKWEDTDSRTLTAGTYHLDTLTLGDGDELVLDTSDGDIELAIDGNFHADDATITVTGDTGAVRVYADITGDSGDMDFTGGTVRVEDGTGKQTYESSRFWVYAPAGIEADIKQGDTGSEFTGVIYAPDNPAAGEIGAIQVDNSDVYGAIVGHIESTDGGNTHIVYDEALGDAEAVNKAGTPGETKVQYLHLSVNRIRVSGD